MPVASTGFSFSFDRNRPTASNRSSENPCGLIIAWHDWHVVGLVCRLTRSRVVSPACRSGASGATAIGGGFQTGQGVAGATGSFGA